MPPTRCASSRLSRIAAPPELHVPRSVSDADGSDNQLDPTVVYSPEGHQHDDMPPSYDQAQEQAVVDARNGITPVDPSNLEAHRLTLNEGPNEAEVWEYRLRREATDIVGEHEPAPEYGSPPAYWTSALPVQRVTTSDHDLDGQAPTRMAQAAGANRSILELVNQALDFVQHAPPADTNTPRLTRLVAIPSVCASRQQPALHESSVQFIRAYARILNLQNISPVVFMEFLDGLNLVCRAVSDDEVSGPGPAAPSIGYNPVDEYIRRVNTAFFHPRGMFVSLQSLTKLLQKLDIPDDRGQRTDTLAMTLDRDSSAEQRVQALQPWIEALDFPVPSASGPTLVENKHINLDSASLLQCPTHADDPISLTPTAKASVAIANITLQNSRKANGYDHELGTLPGNDGRVSQSPRTFESTEPSDTQYVRYSPHGSGPSSSRPVNEYKALSRNMGKRVEDCGESTVKCSEEDSQNTAQWSKEFGKITGAGYQSDGRNWTGEAATATSEGYQPRAGSSIMQILPSNISLSHDQTILSQGVDGLPEYCKATADGSTEAKGKAKVPKFDAGNSKDHDYEDHDTSSTSSVDTDSDSDSTLDSDDEEWPSAEIDFQQRIRRINVYADRATNKGKKSALEISRERDVEIALAQAAKKASRSQVDQRAAKHAALGDLKQKGHDLKTLYRQKKRELRVAHSGKKKGKANKTGEWREAKREYRIQRKKLRKEKRAVRKEWRGMKKTIRKTGGHDMLTPDYMDATKMVWIVIDNLHQCDRSLPK